MDFLFDYLNVSLSEKSENFTRNVFIMSVSTARKRISRYINFTVLEKTIFVFTL